MKKSNIFRLVASITTALAITLASACSKPTPTPTATVKPTQTATPAPTTTPTPTVIPDRTPPTVSSIFPDNTDIGVALNSAISAIFSKVMDPATLTNVIFTLKQGTTPVTGTVTYSGITATFKPAINLSPSTLYTATMSTGAKDMSGNALANDFVSTFTTGIAPDTTPPMVSATVPAKGSTGISVNSAITAFFSEAIDPLTVTPTTFFTLKQGTTLVEGTVTSVGASAVFTPAGPLASSNLYTATLTTGAKDLAGNALASNYTWSFTTTTGGGGGGGGGSSISDTTPPTVSATIPVNLATGVAINSAMSAVISEALNPLTVTTTTFTLKQGVTPVAGAVTYALVTATFTPSVNLAASTIYTATITTGVKDLAGNALAADKVWTFTTGVAADIIPPTVSSTIPINLATGVAINSAMSAVISEALNPLTVTTTTFTLKQGVTPVAGAVTYALVTATFTPSVNLAASTIYTATITTGVKDLAGNALAADKVWTFTTGVAADIIPPTVSSTIPINLATGVAINSAMSAVMSEALDPLTVTTTTFTLKQGVTPVAGAVTYALVTATFTPSVSLAASTIYTATITTGVKDLAGNALAADKVWTFTTGVAADIIPPTVSSTIPINLATGVAINSAMSAVMSEALDPLTVTTTTFTLKQGVTPVAGAVTYALVTATFTPSVSLAASTIYTATITTGVKDLAGNALAADKVWTFTTGVAADIIPPTVSSTIPINLATGVAINSAMSAVMSEALDPLTVTTTTFTLKQGVTPVAGAVTYALVTATFTPSVSLAASTIYTATITTGVKDLAGNALAADKVWTFTTGVAADIIPPTVSSTIPINLATGVAINSAMSAVMSEALDPLTVTTTTFTLKQGVTPVAGAVTYALVTATFTPSVSLAASTIYTATITTGVKDLAGNALAADKVWTFTTAIANPTSPVLGEAGRFVILASQRITTTAGSSIVNGDMGIEDQARSYYAGFTPGVAPGQFVELTGGLSYAHDDISPALIPAPYASTIAFINQVRTDLGIAYTFLAADPNPGVATQVCPTQLGGLTLTRGVYKTASNVLLTSGPLHLDAQGDPNSIFIFSIDGTFTVGAPSGAIILDNGAQAKNIYWRTGGTTTIEAGKIVYGNVFAWTQINVLAGASVTGRLFAVTDQVTLISNTVTKAP